MRQSEIIRRLERYVAREIFSYIGTSPKQAIMPFVPPFDRYRSINAQPVNRRGVGTPQLFGCQLLRAPIGARTPNPMPVYNFVADGSKGLQIAPQR
jgi:hypothetical protein